MSTCIDLREHFGDRYRVTHETEGRKAHATDDPWDLICSGSAGFVAPWGGLLLVACTRSGTTTRRILAAVPDAVVVQDGSDGQNVTFDLAHFEAVASILRLRKRRRLSEEQKRRLAESNRPFRFTRDTLPVQIQRLPASEGAAR